jgi:Rod binding domain-containing protein
MSSLISGVLTSGLGTAPTVAQKNSPQKIHEAASQFESLLIGQMLKATHEDGEGGWLGTGEDQTASSATGMADEYLAQSMSKRGGFGLAKSIAAGLAKASSSNPATQPQPEDSVSMRRTGL